MSIRHIVRQLLLLAACCVVCLTNAHAASGIKVVKLIITNAQGIGSVDEPVVVPVDAPRKKIAPDFDGKAFLVMTSDATTIEEDARAIKFRPVPAQADDLDADGKVDEITFVLNFVPRERRVVTIAYGDESVIAPLRVSFPKRAHAAFSKKYEGMGWESDRVAWRLYFDRRNAIDLFGKLQPTLALDYFAQPGVDYHQESPFGRDIYKNGDALGLGSIGAWVDGHAVKVADVAERTWKVVADGPVRAIVDLNYKLVEALPPSRAGDVIGKQLLSCGTHVGANYRAACRAKSRADLSPRWASLRKKPMKSCTGGVFRALCK